MEKGTLQCLFKNKWAFISLLSLAWGKSPTLRTCTSYFVRVKDAKIERSRDAPCTTKESPKDANEHRLSKLLYWALGVKAKNEDNGTNGMENKTKLITSEASATKEGQNLAKPSPPQGDYYNVRT